MSIESYNLVEHFDYMTKYIPQPFYINSNDVKEFKHVDDEYIIVTNRHSYTLTKGAAKKLVDSLGIKIKLFSSDSHEETDVIEQIMPAVNKLFKCFADCFVFYAGSDDTFTITDLNVNESKGAEGTKYENGPSPWKLDITDKYNVFTCFTHFLENYVIEHDDNILVKADDIMSSPSIVSIKLFKTVSDSVLQPMLSFNSKFSNMSGFSDIHPVLYDVNTDIYIVFPMNYSKSESDTFESLWKKVSHLNESTDLNDYIFREINELAASKETPSAIKNFISTILVENTLNINQPVNAILTEANTLASNLKPSKVKKFKKQLGQLIGYCMMSKHHSCHECGHMDLID